MSIQEEKIRLRTALRALRKEWERDGSPEEASVRILARIEALPAFKSARTVLLYASMPGEVPTGEWLRRWKAEKRLVLPRVSGEALELREYGPELLAEGYMGIAEPSETAAQVQPEEVDIAIIPGVAFDAEGHRLGHGKGYYDRLLPSLRCPVIGVALPYRLVAKVPSEPHDRKADMVLV